MSYRKSCQNCEYREFERISRPCVDCKYLDSPPSEWKPNFADAFEKATCPYQQLRNIESREVMERTKLRPGGPQ